MTLKSIIEEATSLLRAESLEASDRGLWKRSGGVIRAKPSGKIIVVGDLHGHLEAFKFARDLIIDRRVCDDGLAVFLGDYIDRGRDQDKVLEGVLTLKLQCPDNVILLRGNHEPPQGLEPYPHDFLYHLMAKYENYVEIYSAARELFNELPYAVIIEGIALLLHGGPPTRTLMKGSRNPLAEGVWPPPMDVLIEILWNDPDDNLEYVDANPRGVGYLWGWKVTDIALRRLGVKRIVRGHQPAEGVAFNHGGKVVTVFTYYGPPYFNSRGAVIYCSSAEGLAKPDLKECVFEVQ